MTTEGFHVIQDQVYGFRCLAPVPDEQELIGFYQSQYYDLIRKGDRAPDLRRILAGGEEAESERSWLRSTLYADILEVLEQQRGSNSRHLLDIGCGTGDFAEFMQEYGWEVTGLEVSPEAAAVAKTKGLEVHANRVDEFLAAHPQRAFTFSAVTLLGVLEHIPQPVEFLKQVKKLLAGSGIIVLKVPNDFSELQLAAQDHLRSEPWWIAIPDHVNYFDFQSLDALLQDIGFELIQSQGDFPMELFLLMGDSYVGNPTVGSECHQKRRRFELAIPAELRRRLYRALAEVQVGRNCLLFGRLKGK